MKLLTLETIKELIPKVGPRLKFIEKWKIYVAEVVMDEVRVVRLLLLNNSECSSVICQSYGQIIIFIPIFEF